jgi:RHS repeat-associated protein
LGQTTNQTLDALRRPIATKLPDGSQTSVAYNALNDIARATDPKGVATTYVKNAWGEVLQETSPDSGTTKYIRDAMGNVLGMQDARGQTSRYSYDALNRLTQVTRADGKVHTFVYDGAATNSLIVPGAQTGYLRSIVDTSGTTTYSRDAFGRITRKVQLTQSGDIAAGAALLAPKSLGTNYSYTSAGDLASIGYPSGLTAVYTRDSIGQITGISTQQSGTGQISKPFITALTTNALGQPVSWQWNHCTPAVASTATAVSASTCRSASRSYNSAGNMTRNEFASYQYDAVGRMTKINQLMWANVPTIGADSTITSKLVRIPLGYSVGYDSRNRVTRISGDAITKYQYDANGNRVSRIRETYNSSGGDVNPTTSLESSLNQTLQVPLNSNQLLGFTQTLSTFNSKGQLSATNSAVNFTRDAAGNLTSDGLRAFGYDAQNRHSTTLDSSGFTTRYLHNALGQRVFKTIANATTSTTATSLGTTYVYADGALPSWSILGEYCNGDSQCLQQEYIWLPTPNGSAIPVGLYRNSRFYALQTDHLGTPRIAVDDANLPVWQWPISAFGDVAPTGVLKATSQIKGRVELANPAPPVIKLNLRYPGQYFDSESNLNYNGYRSYAPAIGSYTQMDPIGLSGGWNRRGYVGGNAFGYSDPYGLDRWGSYGYGRYNPSTNPSPTFWERLNFPDTPEQRASGQAIIDGFSGGCGATLSARAGVAFFEGTRYSERVLGQMKSGDFHGFPRLVENNAALGSVSTVVQPSTGLAKEMLTIPGSYGGVQGVFEFIKHESGVIYHRLFKPGE